MFANTKAFSGFAVDDLEAAKKFYGDTLGLSTSEQYGLLTLHLAGGRDTLVYPKPDHVPASYTILNFQVDDIDAAVGELSSRGVPDGKVRRPGAGREGHQPGRGTVHRLVQGPGGEHPGGAAGALARAAQRPSRGDPGDLSPSRGANRCVKKGG